MEIYFICDENAATPYAGEATTRGHVVMTIMLVSLLDCSLFLCESSAWRVSARLANTLFIVLLSPPRPIFWLLFCQTEMIEDDYWECSVTAKLFTDKTCASGGAPPAGQNGFTEEDETDVGMILCVLFFVFGAIYVGGGMAYNIKVRVVICARSMVLRISSAPATCFVSLCSFGRAPPCFPVVTPPRLPRHACLPCVRPPAMPQHARG